MAGDGGTRRWRATLAVAIACSMADDDGVGGRSIALAVAGDDGGQRWQATMASHVGCRDRLR